MLRRGHVAIASLCNPLGERNDHVRLIPVAPWKPLITNPRLQLGIHIISRRSKVYVIWAKYLRIPKIFHSRAHTKLRAEMLTVEASVPQYASSMEAKSSKRYKPRPLFENEWLVFPYFLEVVIRCQRNES